MVCKYGCLLHAGCGHIIAMNNVFVIGKSSMHSAVFINYWLWQLQVSPAALFGNFLHFANTEVEQKEFVRNIIHFNKMSDIMSYESSTHYGFFKKGLVMWVWKKVIWSENAGRLLSSGFFRKKQLVFQRGKCQDLILKTKKTMTLLSTNIHRGQGPKHKH